MPTLEQQLADAIKAQNDLTQAVALYKSELDQTVADWKTKIDAATKAALESTRVSVINGVTQARSVVSYQHRNTTTAANAGVFVIKTPIPVLSDVMVRFDIKGYDYGEAKIIDLTIVTYVYRNSKGADGELGSFISNSAIRRGNSGKSNIWLAKDPATNKACLVFGAPKATNYFVSFVVDATFHVQVPSTATADWVVETNNSDAPAAGVTTGFGLVNLLSL